MVDHTCRHPVLVKTVCLTCLHQITPEEVSTRIGIARSIVGSYYMLRFSCIKCGRSGTRAVPSHLYGECAQTKAGRHQLRVRLIEDIFLAENSVSEQVFMENATEGKPLDIREQLDFHFYLDKSIQPLEDLERETIVLQEAVCKSLETPTLE